MAMGEIYIAEFHHGRGKLAKMQVERETTKTFRLTGGYEELTGAYMRVHHLRQVNKAEVAWFRSQGQAYLYLHEKASEYVEQCRKELSFAQGQLNDIARLADVEKSPECRERYGND